MGTHDKFLEALKRQDERDRTFKPIAEYIKTNNINHLVIRDGEFVDFFCNEELVLCAKRSRAKSCILTDETIRNPEWTLAINDNSEGFYKYHTLFILNRVNAPLRAVDKYFRNRENFEQILISVDIEIVDSSCDESQYDNDDNYSYDKYNGAYGFDDDTIDSAFEGEPEAYWNID